MRPDYAPTSYRASTVGDAMYWSRPVEPVAEIAALVEDARRRVDGLLEWRPRRALHVVLYATNAEACAALDRTLSPSALLARRCTRTRSR